MSYDEIVIENALDLYDRYEITMEDAIGIAMEKLSAQDKLELRNAAVSGLRKGAKVGAGVGAGVGVLAAGGSGDATSLIGAPIAGAVNGSLYGAGIGALKSYAKIHKRNLVKAAELERQAQEAEAKAAAKREEAENAVAQAKEAASYFAY
jgi:hypothetical protein